ncbi:uncharacterized protein [Miscanthus floridulus]|uniref:uncharacterized protein n=1 Tax=Miscanthus floridulus TaxID=154761 RepID=UPI0034588964
MARMVEKLLRCIPKKYSQIMLAIEMLLDFNALSIEEVTERIKVVQDHEEAPHTELSTTGGKLLYIAEQWRAFEKKKEIGEEEKGSSFPLPTSVGSALLHLNKSCAHAFLGTGTGDDKIDYWYLDTSATHHMIGRREFFSNLDTGVKGSVKFGNASTIEIKGVSSIVFTTKTGEPQLLTSVYYIPMLRNSIISSGQLDENGSCVEIKHMILRNWDHHR